MFVVGHHVAKRECAQGIHLQVLGECQTTCGKTRFETDPCNAHGHMTTWTIAHGQHNADFQSDTED